MRGCRYDGPLMILGREVVEGCPACGSAEWESWRRDCRDWQQPQADDRFRYERCFECSACFLADRPLESELDRVYFTGYGPYGSANKADAARPRSRRLTSAGAVVFGILGRRLARQLERTYAPEVEGEMLLDYGCGTPAFLDDAREKGFTTVGVDFTEDVLQSVRARGHRAILAGNDFDQHVPDESVSCVRMNHVMEHLYHPRETLTAIHAKMRPSGRIHLSTPNPGGVGSRLFRRRWFALDCPRHAVLYKPDVLRKVMQQLGFGEISIVQEIGSKDLTRSWGIVRYEQGRIAHGEIAAMANNPLRSALFLPVACAGAVASAADRYHLFARRT
jgi:SAM-dependent methyltransferase